MKKNMNRNIFRGLILALIICCGLSIYLFRGTSDLDHTKSIIAIADKVEFNIEIKDSIAEQAKGLSGMKVLADNTGMLFIYDEPRSLGFWMKEMNFALDFLWIRDSIVIGIDENIPHPAANNNEIYRLSSPGSSDMVLEINAGEVEEYGIEVGDEISLR